MIISLFYAIKQVQSFPLPLPLPAIQYARRNERIFLGGQYKYRACRCNVKPTVFANVTNDMTIVREEIFCPMLCILGDEQQALG